MYDLLIFVLTLCFIGCIIAIGAVFALYSPIGDIQGFDFMRGLGTVINVALLIFGGLCGLLFGKKLNERIKDTLLSVNAVAIMMLAVGGVMQNMLSLSDGKLSTGGTVMMIVSLTLGGLIGEIININALVDKFGEWLRIKSHSTGDDSFVSAFVSASCTVCIGAMAVIGSINDGVSGDYLRNDRLSGQGLYLLRRTCGNFSGCHNNNRSICRRLHDRPCAVLSFLCRQCPDFLRRT